MAAPEGLARIAAYDEGLDARSRDLLAGFSTDQLRTVSAFLTGSHDITTAECDSLLP